MRLFFATTNVSWYHCDTEQIALTSARFVLLLTFLRQNLTSAERAEARVIVTISDVSFDGGGQHAPPYLLTAELPSLEDSKLTLFNFSPVY